MARLRNIECFRGEDVEVTVTVYTDDASEEVQNITGWTLAAELMTSDNATPITTLTNGDGITITGALSGELVLLWDSDVTDMTPRTYRYTLSRVDDGSHAVLAYGAFRIKAPTVAGLG